MKAKDDNYRSSFISQPPQGSAMIDDPLVDQILAELLETGGSPEEACRTRPELLPKVRARFKRLRLLEDEVGVLFPPSDLPGNAIPAVLRLGNCRKSAATRCWGCWARWNGSGLRGAALASEPRRCRKDAPRRPLRRATGISAIPREAQAVAGLRHPNVVPLYDVGDVDGRPYFTMELVEGGSLARKLAEHAAAGAPGGGPGGRGGRGDPSRASDWHYPPRPEAGQRSA